MVSLPDDSGIESSRKYFIDASFIIELLLNVVEWRGPNS